MTKNVFNGTMGIIKKINNKKGEEFIGILFDGDSDIIYYSKQEFLEIELAYAITIHKCQGSGFKNVIVALDYSAWILLSKQLIYTALTRASEHCFVCCELKAFRYGISIDKAGMRNTFLYDFLKN